MRMRERFIAVFALMLVSLPITLCAQFQPPTEEELKMTAEPKAPGAAAIYLYREETVDDNLHFHSFFARIKVLTEKGKELATVEVPYYRGSGNQITDIKARTIHADGTVIPLDVKPSDLVERKGIGYQLNKMVFTLQSVEVGSILEYRWQERYDDKYLSSPFWDVQQPFFVRRAHYSFIPYKYLYRVTNGKGDSAHQLLYTTMLPPGVKVVEEASGRYTLDTTDIVPQPKEEHMPPIRSLIQRVVFYYSPYLSKDDFWKNEGSHWSKEVDHFANESQALKGAVATIVAAGDSEEQKARKLYDAVMALDNTNYTRRKSQTELHELHLKQTRTAEDVWTQKSGSSAEIALLYLAMARISGLKAYAMTLCNRDEEVFNPFYLSLGQFNDVLVAVELNGKTIPLDPGKRFTPFGQLAWKHTLTEGLRQSDHGPSFVQTPVNSYKDAATMRLADVAIARDGTVSGAIRISMSGPEATRWRELAIENDEDELKKRYEEQVRRQLPDGVTAEFDHFLGLEDYHAQLMAVLKLSGSMGTATGKRVFVPGVFFASRESHPFLEEEKRQTAVSMEYADTVQDVVTYRLADGFGVESAPTVAAIPWPGRAAFNLKCTTDKGQVTVDRSFVRAFALLDPKEYPQLRDFYQKVAAADQQQLVLTAAPAAVAGTE
jgi:transglutaminase-like putative cysteine protease